MKSPVAQSRLAKETDNYLLSGQFDRPAQVRFVKIFNCFYGSTPLADRIDIAQKLGSMRTVPRDVVLSLCCDVDAVAAPVFARSPLLIAADLTIQIMQGSCAKREAIASRSDLTAMLISQLMLFGEASVARRLAENCEIRDQISEPLRRKIEHVGAVDFEQAESKGMSQDKDMLDALVSSMEQDWCAHYKPEVFEPARPHVAATIAMQKDESSNACDSLPALETDHSIIDPVTQQDPMTFDSETPVPSLSSPKDETLLLNDEDMKILDQLSEADWDALDDDAIEALARQLAEVDRQTLDQDLVGDVADETVYGLPQIETNEASVSFAPSVEIVPAMSEQAYDEVATTQPEALALTPSLMEPSDLPEMQADEPVSDSPAIDAPSAFEFEEETGPASFLIGALDGANAPIPPLEIDLAANERQARVVFGSDQISSDDTIEAIAELDIQTDDAHFVSGKIEAESEPEATVDTPSPLPQATGEEESASRSAGSFTISATEPAQYDLPEPYDMSLQSDCNADFAAGIAINVASSEPLPSFDSSSLEPFQAALKRPLDEQEAQLLSQTSRKLEAGAASEESVWATDSQSQSQAERKPKITLTIRKSSGEDITEQSDTDRRPDAPIHSEPQPDAVATARPEPETARTNIHMTSATEDDWKRALAHLNGDLPFADSADASSRLFTVPRSDNAVRPEDKQGDKGIAAANPFANMESDGLNKVVEAIENELDFDPIPTDGEDTFAPEPSDAKPDLPLAFDETAEDGASTEEPLDPPSVTPLELPVFAEALPIPRGEPDATSAQTGDESEPLIHAHVPLGFMPDMIGFKGLELVEALPDMPSASDLLLRQAGHALPHVELVEPVEIDILENGKITALEDLEATPMQVITRQLEAQREALNALRQKMRDYEDASRLAAKPLSDLNAPAPFEHSPVDEIEDISSLPELSEHKLVDVEDYQALKEAEVEVLAEPAAAQSEMLSQPDAVASEAGSAIGLAHSLLHAAGDHGIAESFYAYDAATRLAILQSILAETIKDVAQQAEEDANRKLLNESQIRQLVAARFSNDRIGAADLMHDISGHRRLDMTQLLQDRGGEALVVYLYSIGVDESSTLSILLHGPDAIAHDYEKITQLITLYHQLYPAAARTIVSQLFGEPRSTTSHQHLSQHDDGAGLASPRLRGNKPHPSTGTGRFKEAERITIEFGRRNPGPEKS